MKISEKLASMITNKERAKMLLQLKCWECSASGVDEKGKYTAGCVGYMKCQEEIENWLNSEVKNR